MQYRRERMLAVVGILLTLTWPMLLGGAIAGRPGLMYGAAVYVVFAALFGLVLLFSGIRGILGS
jgi:hypothetical protein